MRDKKGSRIEKIVLNASAGSEKDNSYQRFTGKVTKESFAKEVISKLPMTLTVKRPA
jgi:hypothetical protein